MKKILLFILIILIVLIIYVTNMDKKVYYLAFGDSGKYVSDDGKMIKGYSFYVQDYLQEKRLFEKYVYEFSKSDSRITDLINMIDSNAKYKNVTLKNALIKADLVTLRIDIDDILSKLEEEDIIYAEVYDYVDEMVLDLEKLFNLIRKYCKENIVFIGAHNHLIDKNSKVDDVLYYLNEKYKSSCKKYNIKYVDVSRDYGEKSIGEEVIKIYNQIT